jgi:glycosyltransferase involved in cell wall biosynthesis
MAPRPKISVIIPVRNEAASLPALLKQLVAQDLDSQSFEIIVADGRSHDTTRAVVEKFSAASRVCVRLVDNPGILASAGRNAGVAAAQGDVILFLDGHCYLPYNSLLRDTLQLLDSTHAQCLCRPQPLLAPTSSATGRIIAAVRASTLGHGRDSLIYNMQLSGFVDPASSGATYRREVFVALGPYDERYDACEDVEFNTRVRKAGMQAYSDPRLAVHYEPRPTISGLFKQMMRYGRGRIRLAAKHPETLSLTGLIPLFLLLLGALMLTSLPFHSTVRVILLSGTALYFLAVLAASLQLTREHGVRCLWQGPAAYLAVHLGLGAGMLEEILSFRWIGFRKRSAATTLTASERLD